MRTLSLNRQFMRSDFHREEKVVGKRKLNGSVSVVFNLEINFQVNGWWELYVKILSVASNQNPDSTELKFCLWKRKLLTHTIESPGTNEGRTQMSLHQDLVLYYVLYLGWPDSSVISPLLVVQFPWCLSPNMMFCYQQSQQSCWGFSLVGATCVTKKSLNKSLWPRRQNLFTDISVDHRPPLFNPDWKWGRWIPKGGATTIRRGKEYWAGKMLSVLSKSLGKWPPKDPCLFTLTLIFPPINSLPCCVILPPFLPQHFNQVVIIF